MAKILAPKRFGISIFSAIALLSAFCAACGGAGWHGGSPNEQSAAERGRADAMKAVESAPASMDRERAVLDISSRRERLRATGDTAAATAYAAAAEAVLDSAGIFN